MGVVSETGIAELTLGGIGWLRRKYGPSSDNFLLKDVVTADGRFLTASETQNQDLFRGIRAAVGPSRWSGRTSRPWRRFPPSSRSDCLLIGHRYSGRARCCGSFSSVKTPVFVAHCQHLSQVLPGVGTVLRKTCTRG
jgi:hypothetical protein